MELIKKKKNLNILDKISIGLTDLEIILTQKCNLACEHCLRGNCTNKEISEDVVNEIFKRFSYIDHLALGGGEISLVPEKIKLITDKLKEHNVIVHNVSFGTNGVFVSDEFINNLKELTDYVSSNNDKLNIFSEDELQPLTICFSFDNFHINQILRHGINEEQVFSNLAKYAKAFGENSFVVRLESDIDLINNGRAKTLKTDIKKVKPLNPTKTPYPIIIGESLALVGNKLCVNCDGLVVPIAIPFKDEEVLKYGNLLTDSNSEIFKNMNIKFTSLDGYFQIIDKFEKNNTANKKAQKRYKKIGEYKMQKFYSKLESAMQRQ